jgi:hypothetical protein
MERPVQSEHRHLQHVVRLLPTPHAREISQHASGELAKSFSAALQQLVVYVLVALSGSRDQRVEIAW